MSSAQEGTAPNNEEHAGVQLRRGAQGRTLGHGPSLETLGCGAPWTQGRGWANFQGQCLPLCRDSCLLCPAHTLLVCVPVVGSLALASGSETPLNDNRKEPKPSHPPGDGSMS